jgi:hypothetical protein
MMKVGEIKRTKHLRARMYLAMEAMVERFYCYTNIHSRWFWMVYPRGDR